MMEESVGEFEGESGVIREISGGVGGNAEGKEFGEAITL